MNLEGDKRFTDQIGFDKNKALSIYQKVNAFFVFKNRVNILLGLALSKAV
ncbi:MAG: hypothetical protein K0B81_02365 [Candidatus Cloacimonetes bacterium]|nr:hypothetical protein [Candidatus Cloacimonadota bacterium]